VRKSNVDTYKHSYGYELSVDETIATREALDAAERHCRDAGSWLIDVSAEVVQTPEHTAAGEFIIVVRGMCEPLSPAEPGTV